MKNEMAKSQLQKEYIFVKTVGAILILILVAATLSGQIVLPNNVQTKIFSAVHPDPITSKTYTDGQGRLLQSHVSINHSTQQKNLLKGNEYDAHGRLIKSFKPFVYTGSLLYIPPEDVEGMANNFYTEANGYPDAEGKAFAEIEYQEDPLDRICKKSNPGADFSFDSHEHFVRAWYFGTKLHAANDVINNDGFINDASLNYGILDLMQDQDCIIGVNDPDHYLTVYRDPNGVFSQEIQDKFGNVIKTSDDKGERLAHYRYDIYGKTLAEHPPEVAENPLHASTYKYDTQARIIEKYTPDQGVVQFKYNSAGLLRFIQTAKQRAQWDETLKPMYVLDYDKHFRVVSVAVLTAPLFETSFEEVDGDLPIEDYLGNEHFHQVKMINIYDDINQAIPYFDQTSMTTLNPAEITNGKGRLVASIYYSEFYYFPQMKPDDKVIEIFSYDYEGRILKDFKSIPSIPLQTVTYSYAATGELAQKVYNNGTVDITTQYIYNLNGRLQEVKRNGETVVTYDYNDINFLTNKKFRGEEGGSPVDHEVNFAYTIRDWIKEISYDKVDTRFIETVSYNKPADDDYTNFDPQYNGNISRVNIDQSTSTYSDLTLNYTYDNFNRLTKVRNGTDQLQDDLFDADYDYDRAGRFIKKTEGYNIDGTPVSNFDGYKYEEHKSRLSYIQNSSSNSKGRTDNDNNNYVYDPNGNMVLDRSKKMTVTYDWRDMPVIFKFYKEIPDNHIGWGDIDNLSPNDVLTWVEMRYDAQGRRVSKQVYHNGEN